MSKAQRPSMSQVRGAVRAAWEAAELREDPQRQQRHAVDFLARALGAQQGVALGIANYRSPGSAAPRFTYALSGSDHHPDLPRCLGEWDQHWGIAADPTAQLTMPMRGPVICTAIRQHMSEREWM